MHDMRSIFERINAAYEQHADDYHRQRLRHAWSKGASKEELDAAEHAIGLRFPEEMREFYMIANGGHEWILEQGVMIPISEIVERWRGLSSVLDAGPMEATDLLPGEPIRKVWWSRKWVLLMECDGACIDFDPPPGGIVGQIIYRCHEIGPVCVIANSFREWLEEYANDFEAGRIVIGPRTGPAHIECPKWDCRPREDLGLLPHPR
jgi:cell wall assembly regulator SMI1